MRDKKIWIFNSGSAFDGNPKWLFMYIIKHRPDITPYWFCYNKQQLKYYGISVIVLSCSIAGKRLKLAPKPEYML